MSRAPNPEVGLDQWVGSAKTAEPIEIPLGSVWLTNAGSRNNVLVG